MKTEETERGAWSSGYPWAAKGDGVPTPETLEKLEAAAIDAFGTLLGAVPDSMKGPGTETDRALERFGAAFFGAKDKVRRLEFLEDATSDVFREMSEETWAFLLMEKAEEAMSRVSPGARAAYAKEAACRSAGERRRERGRRKF